MHVFNIDYMPVDPVGIVSLMGYTSDEQAKAAPLMDGCARLTANGANDIASLGEPVIAALWTYKAPKGTGMPADNVAQAIWDLLNPTKDTVKASDSKGEKPSRKNKSKKSENNPNKELPTNTDGSTSSSPDGAVSTGNKRNTTMATTKKKAAKKKTATAKPANGMPREGTKKDKLLKAASKSGGITKAEGQKITGWKEFRGTLGQLADAAKKKVVTHKDPDGKKATRWEVKK